LIISLVSLDSENELLWLRESGFASGEKITSYKGVRNLVLFLKMT